MPEPLQPVQSAQPPCHQMNHDSGQEEANQGGSDRKHHVMFLKDCAGIDLQSVSHGPDISGPDVSSGKALHLDGVALLPVSDFSPLAVNAIRGPPPQWQLFSPFHPSIILTTQRLRI
ncbi:MAG: hypothetical protein WC043_01970 [Pseudobdellovibrionaceae bacterium]